MVPFRRKCQRGPLWKLFDEMCWNGTARINLLLQYRDKLHPTRCEQTGFHQRLVYFQTELLQRTFKFCPMVQEAYFRSTYIPYDTYLQKRRSSRTIRLPPHNRLIHHHQVNPHYTAQKEFQNTRDWSKIKEVPVVNVVLLDLLFNERQMKYKSCFCAILDISKAFDSVSHLASYNPLCSFLEYI